MPGAIVVMLSDNKKPGAGPGFAAVADPVAGIQTV